MNRDVLITGGSGKFGRRLIRHFMAQGDRVAFTARSESSIALVLADYPEAAGRLVGLIADFNEAEAVQSLLGGLIRINFHVTGLVNNARSVELLRPQADGTVTRAQFLGEYLIDVVAPYELTMALAAYSGSRLQRVVNIGSQYGSVAATPRLYDNFSAQSPIHYGVAKAALAQMTRELAVRLADRNIQVNCIAFGGVEGRVDDAFKQRYAALTPMGRMLSEDEIAGPVDFLLSPASQAMTGHVMAVDGGWTIW